jgi:hypothetical protein
MTESKIEAARRILIELPDAERGRIRDVVEELCLRHDVGGPAIYNVQLSDYEPAVSLELRKALIALRLAGELKLSLPELELLCDVLAHDVAQLRQVRFAHDAGRISTAQMRATPVYAPFRRYFDEEIELVIEGVVAALVDREQALQENPEPCPPVSAHATGEASADPPCEDGKDLPPELDRWIGVNAILFAFAEDVSGSPCVGVDRQQYIEDSLPRLRREIIRSVRNKELTLSEAMMERLVRLVAQDVYAIRCLAQEHGAGRISRKKLKRSPLYRRYQAYFSPSADQVAVLFATMALGDMRDERKIIRRN